MGREAFLLACLLLLARHGGAQDVTGKPAVWMSTRWETFDENDPPGTPQPYPPHTDSWKSDNTTIMVSISSFRDYRCPKTLYNLFTKSKNPNRVFIGVVQQNNDGDPDCLHLYCKMIKDEREILPKVSGDKEKPKVILENCPHADQVRMMRVQAEDAKGPTYGRYLGGKLLGNEEFCMQVDAHMDFEDNWDEQLLNMWGLAKNEYAVLTTYVPHLDQMHTNLNGRFEVPQVCKAFFTDPDRMVRNEQATNCIWLTRPKLTTTWAAGFAFNKCHADRRAPYDPHLPSLFDGEEYSKYARLWTRGYDTYTPHRNVVYHDYTHGPQTKDANAWARKYRELQRSHDRLRTLLGMPDATVPRNGSGAAKALGQWDLGTKRSLDQLIDFTGIDTRNYKMRFDNCGKRTWVPFTEGDDDDFFFEQIPDEPVPKPKPAAGFTELERRISAGQNGAAILGARPGDGQGPSGHAAWLGGSHAGSGGGPGKLWSGVLLFFFFLAIWGCLVCTPKQKLLALSDDKAVKVV